MKTRILFGMTALLAGSLFAADSNPKDDITSAAKKLAEKDNYSWKITMDLGPNSQFTPGPSSGKTEKDGFTWLSVSFNDNTTEGVTKDKKVAIKTEDGWQSAEEASGGGGGFNPVTFMARRMQNLKVPAAEAADLASKVQDLKKDGNVYSGTHRGRRQGNVDDGFPPAGWPSSIREQRQGFREVLAEGRRPVEV